MTTTSAGDADLQSTPPPLSERLAGFVHVLRANGFKVGVAEQMDTWRTVTVMGIDSASSLKDSLKGLLCSNYREWEMFNDLFEAYWRSPSLRHYATRYSGALGEIAPTPKRADDYTAINLQAEGYDLGSDGASSAETLLQRDFEFIEHQSEMEKLEELAEDLARKIGHRISHRQKRVPNGRFVNMRRTIRTNFSYGGLPIKPEFTAHNLRQPHLLVATDVSRSMSVYGYIFLRFMRGLLGAFTRADAFACHTRLVNLTDALHKRDLTTVRRSLNLVSAGWSSGTRLGECLAELNRSYSSLMSHRTIMLVISDGLDTCPPQLVAEQTRLLRSRNRKLVWLNPLLGRTGYEPRTAAMQAALPNVDLFAPAHNLQSLIDIAPMLARL